MTVRVLALRDGVELVAPGGVYLPDARALVVADLHVGYTPTLRARGYAVPAAPDDELLARVASMLACTGARRVVVAGDLVHGVAAATRGETTGAGERARSPLAVFARAVSPREVTVVLGNHDHRPATIEALARLGLAACTELALGPHRVHHGDVPAEVRALRAAARAQGGRVLVGHLHPALALDDGAGAAAVVPAFVCAPGMVCLPALSPFSRGLDVRSTALRTQLDALLEDDEAHLGAAAVIGERVVSVGNVFNARRRARA